MKNESSDTAKNRTYSIALLCGGTSSEREVSLWSANKVEELLVLAGNTVAKIDTASPRFFEELQNLKPDVAFLALHGKGGEDGVLQAVLEMLKIPYTGSGVLANALALDKYRSKIMYEAAGIKTPNSLCLKANERDTAAASTERVLAHLSLPVVVKPNDEGSSVGITIVTKEEVLPRAIQQAFDSSSSVLLEQYIEGTEITISVLGSTELTALPALEIVPKNEFYDYESKYEEGGSVHLCPARISEQAREEASRVALLAHELLDCYAVSRTDMIIDQEDTVWVIETNTIPGMTETSLLPDAALHAGINAGELYALLIKWALERDGQYT